MAQLKPARNQTMATPISNPWVRLICHSLWRISFPSAFFLTRYLLGDERLLLKRAVRVSEADVLRREFRWLWFRNPSASLSWTLVRCFASLDPKGVKDIDDLRIICLQCFCDVGDPRCRIFPPAEVHDTSSKFDLISCWLVHGAPFLCL